MEPGLRIGVLGPLDARRDGTPLALGTPRQRRVLAAMALRRGRPVSPDALIDLVWGEEAPASADNTLQGYVSGLRKVLERDHTARARPDVVVLGAGGYELHADLDISAFEAGIEDVDRAVGTTRDGTGVLPAVTASSAEEILVGLEAALRLWRGTPFVELGDAREAVAERARLEDLRMLGLEHRAALEIVLGREARVASGLEPLTASYPLRERLWALRTLALVRAGRQADALAVLAEVRDRLADELGIDPGPELAALQVAVLRQDPALGAAHDRTSRVADPEEPAVVGRDEELARLDALVVGAIERPGRPAFAIVTGEPGVGKSRLCRELQSRATRAGARVLTARCSQDEGAPPLWPWSQLLAAAGARTPTVHDDRDAGARFRAWADSVAALLDAVAARPTVIVLEDLQWADASTLRVLGLLAATELPTRLVVVLTWRSDATPPRPLGELAAGLARQHALHLPLDGLDVSGSARLLADATGTAPSEGEAAALHERTGGNPFFLVELARLGSLDGTVPGGIQAVLGERIGALPDAVQGVLQVAAVLGREFDAATLETVLGEPDGEVVDRLEVAHSSGLVQEVGIDRFRFAHDLLRDAARSGVTRTRSARIHAAVAQALAARGTPGSEADLARHWLRAGPAHAALAWRAAREAAEAARRLHAHDERVHLLREAVTALDGDPEALQEERCDLLIDLADALRIGAQWFSLRPVVHEAIELAERLGDDERTFAAATMPTNGAFWLASPYGQVDGVVVACLRRLLADLPPYDDPRRCRVMLSLASEIYYATSIAEREALVDEAIAMARRLGDDRLLLTACLAGSTSVWRSSRSTEQHALATEAVALATALGDPSALSDALTVRAAAANDLGLDDLLATIAAAREAATEQRLLFSQVLLDGAEIGWRLMRGEDGTAQELLDDMTRAGAPMELAQLRDSLAAVGLMQMLWHGQYDDLLGVLLADDFESVAPIESFVAALLCRAGRVDEVASYLEEKGLRVEGDDWLSPAVWSLSAEVALHLGDRQLAAAVYERLTPLAGRPASAGQGIVVGPVDAYLAMAALTVGERETARRHADEAERVATRWEAPPVLRWVREVRTRWEV